jgi:PAS domain S-box-containing protein
MKDTEGKKKHPEERLRQLESLLSDLKFELEESRVLLREEQERRQFYQLVADFTFGWELWFSPSGKINYCSPSCHDLTGFTTNQVMAAPSVSELLVYNPDREKFDEFISNALDQLLVNPSLEFRILTRTRQLRWCSVNLRGVYNRQGRYLGFRASVHDITRLKGALGHINELSAGKEMENRSRQRLETKLEIKERELVDFLLQLSQKNELIAFVVHQLRSMIRENGKNECEKAKKLLELLENTPLATVDWNMVEVQLEKLYPGFVQRLLLKHPKLTPKDKKLCACLRLGLSSKEIAGLNNLSPPSVEIARVRLRKKLKLRHETRLTHYLSQI